MDSLSDNYTLELGLVKEYNTQEWLVLDVWMLACQTTSKTNLQILFLNSFTFKYFKLLHLFKLFILIVKFSDTPNSPLLCIKLL